MQWQKDEDAKKGIPPDLPFTVHEIYFREEEGSDGELIYQVLVVLPNDFDFANFNYNDVTPLMYYFLDFYKNVRQPPHYPVVQFAPMEEKHELLQAA